MWLHRYDVHIIRDIKDGCADDLKTRARLDIQGGFKLTVEISNVKHFIYILIH